MYNNLLSPSESPLGDSAETKLAKNGLGILKQILDHINRSARLLVNRRSCSSRNTNKGEST